MSHALERTLGVTIILMPAKQDFYLLTELDDKAQSDPDSHSNKVAVKMY